MVLGPSPDAGPACRPMPEAAAPAYRPDVVFDGAGGSLGRSAFEVTAPGGRFSAHGMSDGGFAPLDQAEARRRGVTVNGIGEYVPAVFRQRAAAALAEAAAGRLSPVIGQEYPLAAAADAHAALESREAVAKTLLRPDRPRPARMRSMCHRARSNRTDVPSTHLGDATPTPLGAFAKSRLISLGLAYARGPRPARRRRRAPRQHRACCCAGCARSGWRASSPCRKPRRSPGWIATARPPRASWPGWSRSARSRWGRR